MAAYLEKLTVVLSQAVADLPSAMRDRLADYFLARQSPDGGFPGRSGGSDLYYTGFAMRGLAILGRLEGDVAQRCADFLRGRLSGSESVVDFLSLVYGAKLLEYSAGMDVWQGIPASWPDAVERLLERLRGADGGYCKGLEGRASSTYHTFLVLLCRELIERPAPEPERIVEFIMSQQDPEGGFREIRQSKRASTNPTAAAIGALQMLDALSESISASTVEFLLEMQTDEGGLRANTRIPIADLLSTFTGLWTLVQLDDADALDLPAVAHFTRALWDEQTGGFSGAALDPSHDAEYTFYGLGTLALLTRLGHPPRI